MSPPPPPAGRTGVSPTVLGVLSGAAAALFWAGGLVAARHGIQAGLSPSDITLHRFIWSGLAFLPAIVGGGLAKPGGMSWGRGLALTLFSGPMLAMLSYAGFLLVPLGHGGVIQPSSATVAGLLLSTFVLREDLPRTRALGGLSIVAGVAAIGAEALATIGTHGLLGDLSFVAAGTSFALFAMLLRKWRLPPIRATMLVNTLSLAYLPLHGILFGFTTLFAAGLGENLLQAMAQGVLAGPLSLYLFARAVVLLGAGRASVFPSLVPAFTLLIGFIALGEVPTLVQLAGLALVAIGFRLTQMA